MAFFSKAFGLGVTRGAEKALGAMDEDEKDKTALYEAKVNKASLYARQFGEKRLKKKKVESTGRKIAEASDMFGNLAIESGISPEEMEGIYAGLGQQYAARVSMNPRYTEQQFLTMIINNLKTRGGDGLRQISYTPPPAQETSASTTDSTEESSMSKLFGAIGRATPTGKGISDREALNDASRPVDPEAAKAYDRAMLGDMPAFSATEPDKLLADPGKDPLSTRQRQKEAETSLAFIIMGNKDASKITTPNARGGVDISFDTLATEQQVGMKKATLEFFDFYRTHRDRYSGDSFRAAQEFRDLTKVLAKGEWKEGANFKSVDNLIGQIRDNGGIDAVLASAPRSNPAQVVKKPVKETAEKPVEETEETDDRPWIARVLDFSDNSSSKDNTEVTEKLLASIKVGEEVPSEGVSEEDRDLAKKPGSVGMETTDASGRRIKRGLDAAGIGIWTRIE